MDHPKFTNLIAGRIDSSAGSNVLLAHEWALLSRYFYSGSANLTEKSLANEEWCFKLAGPVVLEVLGKFAGYRQRGKLWNGK